MRAIQLNSYSATPDLHVIEKPTPQPGQGQVLIKMAAAPINPSDVMFTQGRYGFKKPLPVVPGFEGSGIVIATGTDWVSRFFMGRRVACLAPDTGDGTWADHLVTSALRCIPLIRDVSLEQGAMAAINPITAWALLDIARRSGHRCLIHTAAASQVGRMLIRLGRRQGIEIVNIVRRPEQVALLQALGATIVLNSNETHFDSQLKTLCREKKIKLAFDAVAGDLPERLLQAMPAGARVTIYGALSESVTPFNPGQFIFKDKTVDGFYLPTWLGRQNVITQLLTTYRVQKLMTSDLHSQVHARVPISAGAQGLETYLANMTEGKVLFVPSPVL